MFDAQREIISEGRIHRYLVTRDGEEINFADVLEMWQENEKFRSFFLSLLSGSPFSAYRWETPPITRHNLNRPFEFVLLNSPELACPPDPIAFAEYFTSPDNDEGIVVFQNLGRDAVLVAPSPRGSESTCGHLAAFIRNASDAQRHALWQVVGRTVLQQIGDQPLWISTAGGGVAWLHVRLDSRPKYYGYSPYKVV